MQTLGYHGKKCLKYVIMVLISTIRLHYEDVKSVDPDQLASGEVS